MPLTSDEALAQVAALYDVIAGRRADVQRADEYYRGKQPLRFASDKWREYHAARYERFSDNWCSPVGNSPNERLRVDGFRLDDDPGRSDDEKALWRDWQANDMEAQSSQGWLASIISRRSFVLVWGDDDDEPVATWERPDQVAIAYDVERPSQRLAALKTWHDGSTEFATLYTPDEVWKWERPYQDVTPVDLVGLPPTAGEFFARTSGLVVPAVDRGAWKPRAGVDPNPMTNPIGVVPMVEMPNRPMLGGDPLSDIAGTMAMQDAINLLWAYLFTAADSASMPARVVMGQEPPKIPILDDNGQKVGERTVDLKKLAEDRILWLTGQNTKIGQWDAANLAAFTPVIETCVTHVAAQTRTPPHYLVLGKGMVNVNAEGMKAAETGLVMKVREMQLFLGPAVREVFRLFALVRNQPKLARQARFGVTQWKDAENHSEAQRADALLKLGSLGFPFAWLAERYGLSQPEVARLLEMREAERRADPIAELARAQAGSQPPDAPPPE
ncbi:phage portal protein [Micromonospora sp. LOL_014]|uniref:phage portal protein n=1 Tax=Micromonospora sp. LOL_014 TaxID=3345415 RepID=UPI003A874E8A